ncbi:MAG TPA: DoxX family protein [Candidatus Methylacidiphilales bacterium]|jgi:putative oxidoreductase|nr:DoxX family protein [Candidatus Methylacidiphilales bacterium]
MSKPTNPLFARIARLYDLLVFVGNHLQSPLLLFMRVVWGGQLIQAGWGKLMHIDKPIAYFKDLNIPFPVENAWLVGFTETFGGLFLVLGLLSRLTAIPLTINFIVAYITTEQDGLKDLLSFDTDKFCGDTAFPYLATAVVVLIFGPGAFSIDYLIGRWRKLEWKSAKL